MMMKSNVVVANVIAVGMFIMLNMLYLISNDSCPYSYDDPNVCIEYFRKMYLVWLLEAVIVALLW
jgi:hypothetical protein